MLSQSELNAVEDILFAEPWAESALDFFGLHGAISASVVGPEQLSPNDLFLIATGEDTLPETGTPEIFVKVVEKLVAAMSQELQMGETPELPEPEDGDPVNALENWCAGFIDTFLKHEEEWLARDEQDTAELLVPMLTLSGLFDDEDFNEVRASEKLSQAMADAIPDSLTDLYLLFHTPA